MFVLLLVSCNLMDYFLSGRFNLIPKYFQIRSVFHGHFYFLHSVTSNVLSRIMYHTIFLSREAVNDPL